ncbi:MAG: hypothetical protein ABJC12_05475 [Saprospiraceae bacterium]
MYADISIYPSPFESDTLPIASSIPSANKLIHLNGTTFFYQHFTNNSSGYALIYPEFKTDLNIHQSLDNLLWILSPENNKLVQLSNILKFGFTYTNDQFRDLKQRINQSINMVQKLVIIGYSFPKSNEKIDKCIFDSLADNAEILIQNPISQIDKLESRFKIAPNRVKEITQLEKMSGFIVE